MADTSLTEWGDRFSKRAIDRSSMIHPERVHLWTPGRDHPTTHILNRASKIEISSRLRELVPKRVRVRAIELVKGRLDQLDGSVISQKRAQLALSILQWDRVREVRGQEGRSLVPGCSPHDVGLFVVTSGPD